jgi:hypothetical protein
MVFHRMSSIGFFLFESGSQPVVKASATEAAAHHQARGNENANTALGMAHIVALTSTQTCRQDMPRHALSELVASCQLLVAYFPDLLAPGAFAGLG